MTVADEVRQKRGRALARIEKAKLRRERRPLSIDELEALEADIWAVAAADKWLGFDRLERFKTPPDTVDLSPEEKRVAFMRMLPRAGLA